jgi:hypothetical protein
MWRAVPHRDLFIAEANSAETTFFEVGLIRVTMEVYEFPEVPQ